MYSLILYLIRFIKVYFYKGFFSLKMFQSQGPPRIPGTKIKNRFLYTSTGLEALDSLMGGDGAPCCSIILIDEPIGNPNSGYSKALQKYFMAEGILHGHSIFIGDVETESMICFYLQSWLLNFRLDRKHSRVDRFRAGDE